MSRARMRLAAACLWSLAALAGAQTLNSQDPPTTSSDAVRAGVQKTLDAYREFAAAGRWDALIGLYADDSRFRWVTNGVVEARSTDDIRKHFLAMPAGTRAEM